jgi:hypothetical protein
MVVVRFITVEPVKIKRPFREVCNIPGKADMPGDKVFGIIKKLEDRAAFGKKGNFSIKSMLVFRVGGSIAIIKYLGEGAKLESLVL